MKLLEESGVEATRRVIDVSGDGPNNQGRMVIEARDAAVAKGITINGLPIMLRKPGYLDIPDLDVYYKDCVIGGQGAFTVPVRERDQFIEAIKTKILLEVAEPDAQPPPDPPHSGRPAHQLPGRRNAVAGPLEQLSCSSHDPADIGARGARRQERRHGPLSWPCMRTPSAPSRFLPREPPAAG